MGLFDLIDQVMERYFQKRNRSLDDDAADTSISRPPLRLKQSHVAATIVPHPTQREIDLDELPYDPADRKRISEYTRNPKKQDEIRRRYLTRGPYRPPPNFDYPYRDIGSDRRRFNPEWFKEYGGWLEYSDKVHKAFFCAAIFSEIAMKDKPGMMHLQLKVGIVGTRNAD